MKVLLRADASPEIGIGHVMRSLALAQALHDGGDEVILATAAELGPLDQSCKREGVDVHVLDVARGSLQDAKRTDRLARSWGAAWICLDGYEFGKVFLSKLSARTLMIDDHGKAGVKAQLIVNGNLYGREAMYPAATGTVLAGPRYALLRREFHLAPGRTGGREIIVTLGGADPAGVTGPLLQALAGHELSGRFVVGPHHRFVDELLSVGESLGWEPVRAPDDMTELLAKAHIAVVGAGATTLECAALGVPMVAVCIADNQTLVARAVQELGVGLAAEGSDPEGAAAAANRLAGDPALCRRMGTAGPALVDGRGAVRVAAAMREALLGYRAATMEDAERLYAWRNDPVTRSASFSTDPVSWEEHLRWLQRRLVSPDDRILVAELEDHPSGVVRLERRGEVALLSITVAPEARGRGLAQAMIRSGVERAAELGVRAVHAVIKAGNEASQRAFTAAGFVVAGGKDPCGSGDALKMVAELPEGW